MTANPSSFAATGNSRVDQRSGQAVQWQTIQWLVSVRDLREARLAAGFSIDILDFKEPDRGPLAPTAVDVWHQAAAWMAGRTDPIPLSAALGEFDQAIDIAADLPDEFSFAKVGPSGAVRDDELADRWRRVREKLSASVELVAVAYADHESAQTLAPERIIGLASRCGMDRVLVDTFDKSRGSTLDRVGLARLVEIGRTARRLGLWWALAGSVTTRHWRQIRTRFAEEKTPDGLPNCVGVRGDVCLSDRKDSISPAGLARWQSGLRGERAGAR